MAYNLFMEVKLFVGKTCRSGAGKGDLRGWEELVKGVAGGKGKLVRRRKR
jgi:hypothetical protein